MLIRAATETITDHRGEGEPLLRKLAGDELFAIARTAIGKPSDINHNPTNVTDSVVLDSEYDMNRKEMQLLHAEFDPYIIQAIQEGTIDAVSINAGKPRRQPIECENNGQCLDLIDDYKCVCPHGTSGLLCEENFNDCLEGVCHHGGTCVDQVGGYQCVCPQG